MVDQRSRTELRDRQEASARQELVPVVSQSPAGNEGRQRKAREAVAGQEALAGEVPVAVEVVLDRAPGLREQAQLILGFPVEARSLLLVIRRTGVVLLDSVLRVELVPSGAIEASPSLAGIFKTAHDAVERDVDPIVRPPAAALKLRPYPAEDGLCPLLGLRPRILLAEIGLLAFQQGERRWIPVQVENLTDRFLQGRPRLREPHRMNMRPHQVFVRQNETWRTHRSGHHELRVAEEILIVGDPVVQ